MTSGTDASEEADEALAADWHHALGRYHKTMCALDRALANDHNITVSDFEVLQQLHTTGGMVLVRDLAAQCHLTQSALSRLITRLEKGGLVTRGTCEEDRRAAWTELTPAGTSCYLSAKPTHRAILRDMAACDIAADCDESLDA